MDQTGESKGWLIGKLVGVWGLVGVTSWSEAASFMAFCLTLWIFSRHVWRDAIRPILERLGYLKPAKDDAKPDDGDDDAAAVV